MTPTCQIRRRRSSPTTDPSDLLLGAKLVILLSPKPGDESITILAPKPAHVEPLCSTPFRKIERGGRGGGWWLTETTRGIDLAGEGRND
jgi:hypothetical protein